MSAGDSVDEDLGGHLTHFFNGNMDGGEHGGQILGGVDVVDADDRDISWDFQVLVPDGPHGAYGGDVVAAEECGDERLLL